MSRRFWVIIISFWSACIIAGMCTYFYISYTQKQERLQFISEFNYDEVSKISKESRAAPVVRFESHLFLNEVQQVLDTMNQYEENIAKIIHHNDHNHSNLEYILSAYQQAKLFKQQFANVEITNTYSGFKEKQFEQIAEATYNYLHTSSIFYIISGKKLKKSTAFIEQQYKTAQDTLSTSKSYLSTAVKLHSDKK